MTQSNGRNRPDRKPYDPAEYEMEEMRCTKCLRKVNVLKKDGVPAWCPMPSDEEGEEGKICAGQLVTQAYFDTLRRQDMI